MDAADRHSLDALDAQRVLANVSERLFGRQPEKARVGRFVLLDRLGAGGMGVVYSAFDPELDRRVAIKVLRHDRGGDAATDRARLLREARALAKLRHPNVVTIHEVGVVEGLVFLAMELVEGQPLDRWIEQPRPWREVVQVLAQAGRGLAAAHAQGLVHRDFKPSNVVLGDDGRVIVLDFGLARSELPAAAADTGPRESGSNPSDALTESRVLVGTPRYMSPEQFAGAGVGAASDQFSFCVALFEALHGERPFAGATLAELAAAVQTGEIRSPRTPEVPVWLDAVVRRGLCVAPEDRFPSMQALLVALERPPRPWWRSPVPWTVVGIAAVAVVVPLLPRSPALEPCPGAESRVAEAWDEHRRQAMEEAFAATGLPYAEDSRRGSARALDDYAERWVQAHHEACAATRIRGEQSEALMDRRMLCLQERLDALDTLAGLFGDADEALVRNAVAASHQLPELEACADVAQWLEPGPPVSAADADRRVLLRRTLARAAAKRHAGRHDEARVDVEGVLLEATSADDLEVRAEAELERAALMEAAGEHEAAAAAAKQALWDAVTIGHDSLQSRAATSLVTLVGRQLRRFEDGHDWSRMAEAVLARHGEPARGVSMLRSAQAKLRYTEGDYAGALAHQERALELHLAEPRPDALRTAELHAGLGLFHGALGHREQALVHHRHVVELRERELGPEHPDTGRAHVDLGALLMEMGQLDAALEAYDQAGRIWRAVYGPDHFAIARLETNLANALAAAGHEQQAVGHYHEAIRVYTLRRGPDDVRVAVPYLNLGLTLLLIERVEDGLVALEEALRIYRATVGDRHPDTIQLHISLSTANEELGRAELALHHAAIAVDIGRSAHGAEHELYAGAKVVEGEALAALGRLDEAIAALEEGAGIYERIAVRASERAEVYFSLAKLLDRRGGGGDRRAAKGWAERALEELRVGTPSRVDRIDEIARWLAGADGPPRARDTPPAEVAEPVER